MREALRAEQIVPRTGPRGGDGSGLPTTRAAIATPEAGRVPSDEVTGRSHAGLRRVVHALAVRQSDPAAAARRADQAAGLRRIFRAPAVRVLPLLGDDLTGSRLLDIAGAIAATGERVLVIDASDEAPGAMPTLADLIDGRTDFDATAIEVTEGVRWLCAGRALDALDQADLPSAQLYSAFARLDDPVGVVLLRTPRPGRLARLVDREGECLLVMRPEDSCIAAAYRDIKLAASARRPVRVLVDGVPGEPAALRVYRRIAQTAERFLGVVPRLVGWLPPESSADRTPGGSEHSMIERLAAELAGWRLAEYPAHGARVRGSRQ